MFSQTVGDKKKRVLSGNNNPPRTLEPAKFFEDIFARGRRAKRVKNSKSKKFLVLRKQVYLIVKLGRLGKPAARHLLARLRNRYYRNALSSAR